MLWIKTLHLAALLVWCAALLGVVAALSSHAPDAAHAAKTSRSTPFHDEGATPVLPHGGLRQMFMLMATPAALMGIAAGTALFPWVPVTEGWLAAKLMVVAVLAGCHLLAGWAILRREADQPVSPVAITALAGLALSAMLLTLWLVLAKPA